MGDGAVTPDYTPAQKLAAAAHFAAKGWPLVGYGGYLYGKRSADAEAKPYYALGYGGLGYGYGYYGKRSAEAETKPYYGLGYGNGLGLGYGYGYLGKRSAEAEAKPYYRVYGYGVAPYAVVPEIEPKATGFIVSPASGAVTPDFTAEQKEANPEIAEGSKSIDVPVVTWAPIIWASVRLSPTTMEDWATATEDIFTARGLLRLSPTMDSAMAMEAMATADIFMARGLLRLRPSPTMASMAMASMATEDCAPTVDK